MEFEDGSQVLAKREDVYTLDEDLPKKVKRRLVSIRNDVQQMHLKHKIDIYKLSINIIYSLVFSHVSLFLKCF